jgi:ADP-ribosylglycohydrolase
MKDHCRGALLGLAVGDALGAAVEFSRPGSFAPVTSYRDGGPHGLNDGEWTDDTSMALALADSIASVEWDLNDQATRYVEWWKTGKYSVNGRCFDIGNTTASALHKFLTTGNALTSGDRSERASGNGSIMRLAPVPVRYAELYPFQVEELSRFGEEAGMPTHASEQCRSACQYSGAIIEQGGEQVRLALAPGSEQHDNPGLTGAGSIESLVQVKGRVGDLEEPGDGHFERPGLRRVRESKPSCP